MHVYVGMLHEFTVYMEHLDICIFQNSNSVFVHELRIAGNFVIIIDTNITIFFKSKHKYTK